MVAAARHRKRNTPYAVTSLTAPNTRRVEPALPDYGQRWQIETAFSMLKRNLGSALRARTYWSQCRESMLRVITHNVMILFALAKVFYRASLTPFPLTPFPPFQSSPFHRLPPFQAAGRTGGYFADEGVAALWHITNSRTLVASSWLVTCPVSGR